MEEGIVKPKGAGIRDLEKPQPIHMSESTRVWPDSHFQGDHGCEAWSSEPASRTETG